jgi:hypothetical protein
MIRSTSTSGTFTIIINMTVTGTIVCGTHIVTGGATTTLTGHTHSM